jgi:predicted nucleic acid-binding protein
VSYHLARNLGIFDALVAETAVGMHVDLATFNQKHYAAVKALITTQPYER